MSLTAVYDTNVIVSAAIKPGSIPASLVALATEHKVRLFLSRAILEEYSEILNRPKFELDESSVAQFLRHLTNAAVMVTPTRQITAAPDEDDNRFLESAREANAKYLVTGNKRHFPFPEFEGTQIVSPVEFARIVMEQAHEEEEH
jgi:putative PIN family toxin of toxin-antitoxin system